MTEQINLSKRLETTASFVDTNQLFADIGSDHAYLPCHICQQHAKAQAIAGEVNTGPFNSAKRTVKRLQLEKQVDVRLGNGLEILDDDEKVQVVIAGMGGSLIRSILENGKDKMGNISRIIAQPNIDGRDVRKVLSNFSFKIYNETIVEENGHFYEVIAAEQTTEQFSEKPTEKEMLFGPLLLKKRSETFHQKWAREKKHYEAVIEQMTKAKNQNHGKIAQYKKELKWMKEVLSNGSAIDK